jgi:hypothetical protein
MDIFDNKPEQWGLRGDPEAWAELREKFKNFNNSKPEKEFNKKLDEEFKKLINKGKTKSQNMVWFENYSQHGMSGGFVSLDWWLEKGLPLLKDMYAKSKQKN